MRIAVINEVSACHRNADILQALDGRNLEVFNVGMSDPKEIPQLTYIHTGLMAASLLNARACDFVVGGCGTGQGFLNSAMQYPGVSCGLIIEPLDAWLFSQINAGNCISLALNKGYGWAANINLQYIFDRLFKDPFGAGYPLERRESQAQSRTLLMDISKQSHYSMAEILERIPEELLRTVSSQKPFMKLLENGEKEIFEVFRKHAN